MTSFVLLIQTPPNTPANLHALNFAKTLLAQGHELQRLFFYGQGVYTAFSAAVTPHGEFDAGEAWQRLVEAHNLDAVVCIAAALRRGVLDAPEALRHGHAGNLLRNGFELAGLGMLVESIITADRCMTFG